MNTPRSEHLKHLLKHLPNSSGVYRMLDQSGQVLYVGKAIHLKKRVTSYFQSKTLSPRIQIMVKQICDIEITVTQNEHEALILENNLIKSFTPKYNILFRDDKSYPFLSFSHHPFPRLHAFRGKPNPNAHNFGPYPNHHALNDALQSLQKIFRLRSCEDSVFNHRSRPCLLFQIRRCSGSCTGEISQADYAQDVRTAIDFLNGKSQEVLKELEQSMLNASAALAFEHAAKLRDQRQALMQLQSKQFISSTHSHIHADILVIVQKHGLSCVNWVMIRDGQHRGDKHFFPEHVGEESTEEILHAFIVQHYLKNRPPDLILSNLPKINALNAFFKLIDAHPKWLHAPTGERKIWLDMAQKNAQIALEQRANTHARQQERLLALQHALNLPHLQTIECFDISHTQGESPIASCVVFQNESMQKRLYRRFKLSPTIGGDDYQSMREVLTRRYRKENIQKNVLPDCIFIDGGSGQIAIALEVLDAQGLDFIPVLGISKGVQRKSGAETLIMARTGEILDLPPEHLGFHLIQEIRDEAHRFALFGHRAARAKSRQSSQLDAIPKIGAKRRKMLLMRFGSVHGIKAASVQELAQVEGISLALAQSIHDYFHEH